MHLRLQMNHSIRWAFNVKEWNPSKEQWKLCLQCVQKEEADRCNRFIYVNDCKASLAGHLLMRKAVRESLGIEYNKIRFGRTESGKPYLESPPEKKVFFNVSHSGDFTVLASVLDFPIGIDVMKMEYLRKKPLADFFRTMRKQFSASEWDFITLPGLEKEQIQRFYRLWCLKESFVKATGTGIAYDLQTLSFSCKTLNLNPGTTVSDTKFFRNEVHQKDWIFEETLLNENHCVAVAINCIQNKNFDERNKDSKCFKLLDFDELMENCIPFENEGENYWDIFCAKGEKQF